MFRTSFLNFWQSTGKQKTSAVNHYTITVQRIQILQSELCARNTCTCLPTINKIIRECFLNGPNIIYSKSVASVLQSITLCGITGVRKNRHNIKYEHIMWTTVTNYKRHWSVTSPVYLLSLHVVAFQYHSPQIMYITQSTYMFTW